ncbi:MAG: zinc ribbon domain-containing protein [Planctomycetes bacterium]|nr:zinc ribbon domain-containing protein [Planctomycetota bacterium]
MPTYEYECQKCEHKFEEFQPITAKPLRRCPACGKLSLRRLIGTGAGIIFKGSGFYQTDYRSDSYKQAAQKEKSGSDSSAPAAAGGAGDSAKSGQPAQAGTVKAAASDSSAPAKSKKKQPVS